MRITTLRIENLRIIQEAELRLEPGLNWLVGPNGAGKTSVLEACSLLASGRSFRSVGSSNLLRAGCERSTVFAELVSVDDRVVRVGLERDANAYRGRVDGVVVRTLSELFSHFPMVFVEPDSGQLLHGPGELRRQFVDWGLFHVEPDFLPIWRRYQRALQQRNSVLRSGGSREELLAWNTGLADDGDRLHHWRVEQIRRIESVLQVTLPVLMPDLGQPELRVRSGWLQSMSLIEALANAEDSDRRVGYSTVGPHRFGWTLRFKDGTEQQQLSRGQAKLTALALWLVQLQVFRQRREQAPMLALDDVMAELDPNNQRRVVDLLQSSGVQTLLTRADSAAIDLQSSEKWPVFHVEQGRVQRQL
ncbi:DNA replication/repair protein RecF [Pseudomarimonas arenosa]|uniref:DNA replication and repair protein RecF n=1 Tax=Pseudomarimonas arenosa TaxID=2774145 RepID=A0AAW3ZP00_9GAMM|nr:DNA replication/repair protein RecF [Pseudomarimonas arenosa]